MVMARKEDHWRINMENIRFGKEELERRQKAPVLVTAEEVAEQLEQSNHVFIVEPRLGFSQKTLHFWIHRRFLGKEAEIDIGAAEEGAKLGHRHTLEAVIYILKGHGYSIIDGKRYSWEPGDMVSVPVFSWHVHGNESEEFVYLAATTVPFSIATGIAIFEEEKYPEYWIFAQTGPEAMKSLIPGGGRPEEQAQFELYASKLKRGGGEPSPAELYYEQLLFAHEEEKKRRVGKVLVKGKDLRFGSTLMGSVAYAVDPRLGFPVKLLNTSMAEIPPGKHSGAHRHIYEEVNYVLAGEGYSIIEDQKYPWKKGDTLAIPVFAWHQYFNTGTETARFLVHSNRIAMENTGYVHTEQGEHANY